MITKSNFKDLPKILGFTEDGNIFQAIEQRLTPETAEMLKITLETAIAAYP